MMSNWLHFLKATNIHKIYTFDISAVEVYWNFAAPCLSYHIRIPSELASYGTLSGGAWEAGL